LHAAQICFLRHSPAGRRAWIPDLNGENWPRGSGKLWLSISGNGVGAMTVEGERHLARRDIELLEVRSSELMTRIEQETAEPARISKPAPDVWSITEVVQHLSLVANGMLRTARPAGRSALHLGRIRTGLLRAILRSRLKIRAPVSAIVPRPDVTWMDARTNLAGSNDRWKAFVEGESFDRTAFTHPFVGRLTPAETASFLVEHFDHHIRQIDRLLARLKAAQQE
jgi:hypothetical protein